jgi:hypothetical protein
MRIPTLPRLLLAALLVLLPQRVSAQFAVFTDLASFLAATSNAGTDSFENLSITGATPSPLARTAGTFGYTATVNTTSFFGAGSTADRWLSTNTATDIVTFGGFGAGVRGIGGLFFGSTISGTFRESTSIMLTARTASGQSTQTLLNTTLGTFLGFVASADLLSLTVEAMQPASGGFAWPTVNDLVIANAAGTNVIPEPSTWMMMVTGFGMLVLIATRNRSRRN